MCRKTGRGALPCQSDSCVPDPTPASAVPELLERIAILERENALLREKIDQLVRKLFGAKSEPSGAR